MYPADSRVDTDRKLNLSSDLLRLVGLTRLINLIQGKASVVIGLVDGPVVLDHPNLNSANIRELSDSLSGRAALTSAACITWHSLRGCLRGVRLCGA
jgi:hypothetical protein